MRYEWLCEKHGFKGGRNLAVFCHNNGYINPSSPCQFPRGTYEPPRLFCAWKPPSDCSSFASCSLSVTVPAACSAFFGASWMTSCSNREGDEHAGKWIASGSGAAVKSSHYYSHRETSGHPVANGCSREPVY
ncbi:Hypothetical predicted protein [Podarcis lilfordi]|uniref:Uncharacterized protein n=1 Tax=Podarcis lilfordi TaxID=74358 RepID=A0AA35LLJ0_9SAUR|nr:Hypothetical predicted protein [Podarcis lilfordi]